MKDMEIIFLRTSEIIPYENNPRHNDEAVEQVSASIREFGFKVPIIIDKDNVIVAGHTRLKASEALGLEKVPCIRADDLTEDQIKAFRLADNKVSELATWDTEKLSIELDEIEMDMSEFGFDDIEIEPITIGWGVLNN
jgi:ParB/RepB/Spo0J family partition protein